MSPNLIFLICLLLASIFFDYRGHRIPNALTFGGVIAGLTFSIIGLSGGVTLVESIAGVGVGMAMLMPMYAMRIMGAGDVKLLAMAGAFLGPLGIFWACLYSLMFGGLLAVIWIVANQGLRVTIQQCIGSWVVARHGDGNELSESGVSLNSESKMPYAAAIGFGVLTAAVWKIQ